MGWLNVVLFFLMLLAAASSAWAVALAIAALFAFRLVRRLQRESSRRQENKQDGPVSKLTATGVALLLLSFIAWAAGGVFSPLALAVSGAVLTGRRWILNHCVFNELVPVEGSILMKKRFAPFSWAAVAEVKPTRGNLCELLSGVEEEIVFNTGEGTSLCLIFRKKSISRARAESSIIARMGRVAKMLSSQAAYLLPLDSAQAIKLIQRRLVRRKLERKGVLASLLSDPLEVAVMKSSSGFVYAIGVYEEAPTERYTVPVAWHQPREKPLLVEVLEVIGRKVTLPQADAHSAFLASLCSSRTAPLGQVIELKSEGTGSSGSVAASVLRSPAVELTRAQLRAALSVYREEGRVE